MAELANQNHAVNRMITALTREPVLKSRLVSDRDGVFKDFALREVEVAALNEGSIGALSKIAVHPMLCMHWLLISNPGVAAKMSVSEYLPIAAEKIKNG